MSGSLHSDRLPVVFDIGTVLLFALFLWAPWGSAGSGAPLSMAWLALPMMLARHSATLQNATVIVTVCALGAAVLGAGAAVAGRMRGLSAIWAAGTWLFGSAVAILMPAGSAGGFLGALLLLLVLRVRFSPVERVSPVAAVLCELWPLGYAAGFAALAWRYNPQLLLKTLLIALGAGLIGRALAPSRATPSGIL